MKIGSIIVAFFLSIAVIIFIVFWAHTTPEPQVIPNLTLPTSTPAQGVSTDVDSAQPKPATPTGFGFKSVMTTYFFVGEPADADNDYIQNSESYWDSSWKEHFGGYDDPANRCGYNPCGFTPLENPFYVALPYGEYDASGSLKSSVEQVPWYSPNLVPVPLSPLKNHWVEIVHGNHTCWGQWEDVGPNNEDDFAYVFGNSHPQNTFGVKAGLDVSPALWGCLGMTDNDITSWRFVEASAVPAGPWLDIITSSGISWNN